MLKLLLENRKGTWYTKYMRGDDMDNGEVRELKDNIIKVRVEESTFKRVLAVAHAYDSNMSDVVRLCIDFGLDAVTDALKRAKQARTMKPAL